MIMEILGLCLLAGTVVFLIVFWPSIPDTIPKHYNFAGEPDRWGGKESLIFLFAVEAGIYLLISVTERFPSIWNTGVKVTPENRERVYRILKYMIKSIKLMVTIIFTYLIWKSADGKALPGWFTFVYLTLIFGDMAFWLIKLYCGKDSRDEHRSV